ncbi:MAG: PEP-CTERM sorting domain-containing protein [Desulfobacteraceae bacterium]|jgi:hypothetical protein
MKNKIFLRTVFIFYLLILPSLCLGYTFNAGAPLFGQETDYWCGAASGQMILSQGSVSKTQTQVWDRIQINKKDSLFYTDPDGLSQTLNDFDSMQWAVLSGAADSHDDVIESLMESMVRYKRPAALLVNHGMHWVVWNSFVSDIDPLLGDAELGSAGINDPWPVNLGEAYNLNETDFKTMFAINNYGLYSGSFVAVMPVPEPSTALLAGLAVLFLAFIRKKIVSAD